LKLFAFLLLILIYSCSEKQASSEKIENPFYDKAYDFQDIGKSDSAFLYFYKAKDVFLQQKDSFGTGKCLVNLAIIQETKGDYFGSQETALSALNYFDPKDTLQHNYLSINYNTLSIVSNNLKNYAAAIESYKKAIGFATDISNEHLYKNNLAITYKDAKDYKKAIAIFETLVKSKSDDLSRSKISDNLAYTKWLRDNSYNPAAEFQKILKIRIAENDDWGLNSSYAHLADYYSKTDQKAATEYAVKMYETAGKIDSPDDQIEALQKLVSLETPYKSKQYFKIYQKLNDSLQTARNKAKNQFAMIRYETEKNKADFLKARTENVTKESKITKRNIGLLLSSLVIIALFIYLKRSRKILYQEKLIEVKNTELKYSKKVHDRVANRIYQIMSQVENTDLIDKNALLFGLENVYETSRDISYDNTEINENQNFSNQLQSMLNSYSSDRVKIIFNGNNEEVWTGVSFATKTEVYLILQELMTNMKKHSRADKVFLKFTKNKSIISISYTDNGVGFSDNLPKNGLQNMENRINSINGKINFDTGSKQLLKVNISFPL